MVLAMSEKLHQRNFKREVLVGNVSAKIGVFKFNNRNTRKRCKICLKLTIKTPDDVNAVGLMALLLTLIWKYFAHFSTLSFVDFEHVFARCDAMNLQ